MQIIITGRHCDVSRDLRETFERRFEHLARYEPRMTRAEVTVTAVKRGFEAEAEISVDRGERIHAHAHAGELRSALDRVVEKASAQLRKAHDRHHEHRAPPMDELFGADPGSGDASAGDHGQEDLT